MKVEYDQSVDAIYIYLLPEKEIRKDIVARTEGEYPIHLDFTQEGKLVGIEILDAREIIDIESLKKVVFKKIG